jgi:hypothetical protein
MPQIAGWFAFRGGIGGGGGTAIDRACSPRSLGRLPAFVGIPGCRGVAEPLISRRDGDHQNKSLFQVAQGSDAGAFLGLDVTRVGMNSPNLDAASPRRQSSQMPPAPSMPAATCHSVQRGALTLTMHPALTRAEAFAARYGLRVPILLAPMAGASTPSSRSPSQTLAAWARVAPCCCYPPPSVLGQRRYARARTAPSR